MPTRSTKSKRNSDDPPQYSIPGLKKVRDKVLQTLWNDLGLNGVKLTLPLMEEAVDAVISQLPRSAVMRHMLQDDSSVAAEERKAVADARTRRREAVRHAFSGFVGDRLTEKDLEKIAVMVSGWWEEAAEGQERPNWRSKPTWAAVKITDLERIPCKGRMFRLKARSFAGATAGEEWSMVLSGGSLQRLIRDAGCRKYDEYRDEDAAGLWFTAQVSFADGRLKFLNIFASSSQERINKGVQKGRRETCKGPFPQLNGKGRCQICPMSMEDCPLARSDERYSAVRRCKCGRPGYFRQVSESRGWCLNCLVTGRYKHVQKTD